MKERAIQEDQQRVAKGQLIALMQAGYTWHEPQPGVYIKTLRKAYGYSQPIVR